MSKVTLKDLANLQNESTAVAAINSNNSAITQAFDNTLSLDGRAPNAMQSAIDMNSNRVLNLPQPLSQFEPLRIIDATTLNGGGTVVIENTVTGGNYIFAEQYGVVGDGVTNNDAALAALSAAIGTGGKTVIFPAGVFLFTTWNLSGKKNVIIRGMGGLDLTYSGTVGTVLKTTANSSVSRAIDLRDHRGCWMFDLQVVYSNSTFAGHLIDASSSFSTGNGSGFVRVQLYQIGSSTNSAFSAFYVRNNVDVVFESVHIAHTQYGWIGLLNAEIGTGAETNVIRCYNCTTIALAQAAAINIPIGWSFYGCNFELSATNAPAGIVCSNPAAMVTTNLSLFGCIFADSSVTGTWINLGNVFGFTMHGGTINTIVTGTGVGISLGSTFVSGVSIQGVVFGGLATGVQINSTAVGVNINGCTFTGTTTPVFGISNCDKGSSFEGNNPALYTVGEYLQVSLSSAGAVTLTDSVSNNVTTLVLTPGDWDVEGTIFWTFSGNPAVNTLAGAIGTTSLALNGPVGYTTYGTPGGSNFDCSSAISRQRISVTVNTTVYLVGYANYAQLGGDLVKSYGTISARRITQ